MIDFNEQCHDPECVISFVHADCKVVHSRRDGHVLGHVFRDSDGNWTYVGNIPEPTGALPSGIANSRQGAENWLHLGDH